MLDYYAILGVSTSATESEIRTAMREKTPAAQQDPDTFAILMDAFETLKDPQKRAEYDAQRSASPAPTSGGARVAGGALVVAGACPVCNTLAPADEGFCSECGYLLSSTVGATPQASPLPKLVEESGRELMLRVGESIVGREGADVALPHPTISRRHARFIVSGGNYVTLEDLGSTNGTNVAGQPLPAGSQKALTHGQAIQFGSVKLTIQIPHVAQPERRSLGAKDPGRAPIAALSGSVSGARLEGPSGSHTLKAAVTTVGRKVGNDIVISTDSFVSGSHAKLVFENGKYSVIDIGSTNGTRLNGRKLSANVPEALASGDTIQFGQTAFTFKG
ncbi:FHA domain-containing protein [Armatimonas rosea]|uniref:PSer/pThr/pTyr-binding forkhead associated (FHA) protein n=1 Tax=Armatimonas rosea TaxID=685828 RepID=A0A7W9SVS5_ARMRO|nr:FHA domain-containing protein [Armatimonas rosea]MBB6053765.1 pSer/pThr/pTyr-binding forkhead associated (FHA) protein [Armatimonas rosea]